MAKKRQNKKWYDYLWIVTPIYLGLGFLIFFFAMFFQMLFNTYLVASGANGLREVVKLFWTFKVPWNWAYHGTAFAPWVAQFAFGFYSMMLTSTLIGLVVMVFYKPRTWCVFCPMGTTTQLICQARSAKEIKAASCNGSCGSCSVCNVKN